MSKKSMKTENGGDKTKDSLFTEAVRTKSTKFEVTPKRVKVKSKGRPSSAH